MNLADLEKTWATQTVAGPVVKPAALAADFERELRSARRRFRGMVVLAVGLLVLSWSMAIGAHLTAIKRLSLLETSAHVAGSIFYLGWLVLAVRSARVVQREAGACGGPVREVAAAALRVVTLQVANYRIAAWSLPLAVVVSAMFSLAKFNRGELHGWGTLTSIGFTTLFFAIVGLGTWQRYRTELKPRREKLEQTLAEMDVGS